MAQRSSASRSCWSLSMKNKFAAELVFVTGNKNKFYEASSVCKSLGIDLEQVTVDAHEIQHDNHKKVTEEKAKSAYRILKRPVVVNDSHWSIPALGGFPGAYMKDVSGWLSTQDFLNLMRDKDDKRILLNECVAFYDGSTLQTFVHERVGHFVDYPKGKSDPSFVRVVEMEGEGMTVAEVLDMGNWEITNERYKHWYNFAMWYAKKYTEITS